MGSGVPTSWMRGGGGAMMTRKFVIHLIPGSASRANIIEIQISAPAVSFCFGTGQKISLFLDRGGGDCGGSEEE